MAKQALTIDIDRTKPFDVVDHEIRLKKLFCYSFDLSSINHQQILYAIIFRIDTKLMYLRNKSEIGDTDIKIRHLTVSGPGE